MPSTVNYDFPTPPFEGVKPNVPAFFKDLADAIDAKMKELNDARIAAEAAIAGTGTWIPFASGGVGGASMYAADFVDYGLAYDPGAYKINRNRVHLRGFLKSTVSRNSNVTILTLPVGARPVKQHILGAYSNMTNSITSGAASAGTAHTHPFSISIGTTRVDIQADGQLKLMTTSSQVLPANGYWSLSGLSFPLD